MTKFKAKEINTKNTSLREDIYIGNKITNDQIQTRANLNAVNTDHFSKIPSNPRKLNTDYVPLYKDDIQHSIAFMQLADMAYTDQNHNKLSSTPTL